MKYVSKLERTKTWMSLFSNWELLGDKWQKLVADFRKGLKIFFPFETV